MMNNTPSWIAALHSRGWALLTDVALDADNASLLAAGAMLGRTSAHGNRAGSPNLENDGVNRVERMDEPLRDEAGNVILSSNAQEFALHTDDSYNLLPAHYVFMHCWHSDASGGGESWLSHVNDMLQLAAPALMDRLATRPYPTPFGSATVLMRSAQGHWRVRFNRRDMVGFAQLRGQSLSEQQLADLAEFEALAMQCRQRTMMTSGDCIVVDNHRMLHGRAAFEPSSGRLLKRLRIA